jgi:hypothetical protein
MQILEARGTRVSQANLAILTAVLAIATLLADKIKPSDATPGSLFLLVAGSSALIASLVYASLVHAGTSKVALTDNATLDRMTGEKFKCPAVEARFITANRDADTVKSLYTANEKRGSHLKLALALQVLFVIFIVLAGTLEAAARTFTG